MENKDLDFEVNLLPVISLLAVLISFLLLTAVWVNVGTLDVSQALGNETQSDKENPPSIFAKFHKHGEFSLMLKDVKNAKESMRHITIASRKNNKFNKEDLTNYILSIKENFPELTTVVILPAESTPYEYIISTMDNFKEHGLKDIGISPL